MRFAWLFLAWIMIEIGLFVTLGGWLGVFGTWAVVLTTGVGGILLIRWQKRNVIGQVMNDLRALGDPLTPAAHSALIVLAGVLLFLPGFLTDAVGLILLIPQVRNLLIDRLRAKARMAANDASVHVIMQPRRDYEDVIDVEAEDVQPPSPRPHKPSGWTKP
ncbi:MAG: FxsA family protein [Cypionkella sp.]